MKKQGIKPTQEYDKKDNERENIYMVSPFPEMHEKWRKEKEDALDEALKK